MDENLQNKNTYQFQGRHLIFILSIVGVIIVLASFLFYFLGKDVDEISQNRGSFYTQIEPKEIKVEKAPISFGDIIRLKRERDYYKSITAQKIEEEEKRKADTEQFLREQQEEMQKALEEIKEEAKKIEEKSSVADKPAKTTPTEYYTIQVGSFKEPFSAENLFDELVERGYKAYIIKKEIKGKGTWYRVKVGRFASKKKAIATKEKLSKEINRGSFVTKG